MCVIFEAVHRITCLSCDHTNPFIVFLCTKSRLVVVDLREPCRPLLSVLLEISEPPFFITSTFTTEESKLTMYLSDYFVILNAYIATCMSVSKGTVCYNYVLSSLYIIFNCSFINDGQLERMHCSGCVQVPTF